jgi:hypothetical protein
MFGFSQFSALWPWKRTTVSGRWMQQPMALTSARFADDHVAHAELLEESERAGLVVVGHPAAAAELDRNWPVGAFALRSIGSEIATWLASAADFQLPNIYSFGVQLLDRNKDVKRRSCVLTARRRKAPYRASDATRAV